MNSTCHRARRRGVTFVELAGAMTAAAALMTVTIAALVAVQRADRRFGEIAADRQAVGRLAERLRRDVHAAQNVAWEADAGTLTLEAPGGETISYRRAPGRWERRVRRDGEQGERLAGAFRLPRRATFAVEPANARAGELVTISWREIARPRTAGRAAPVRIELVAAVGRDLELLHP